MKNPAATGFEQEKFHPNFMATPTDHKVEVELVDVPLDSPMTAAELAQLDSVYARTELAFLE